MSLLCNGVEYKTEVYECECKCEARRYGNCSKQVTDYDFICHYRPKSKYNAKGYDETIQVSMCDVHYNWLVMKTGQKIPEMYGWDLDDALDILSYCDFTDKKYTFWYCDMHDDGFLIKNNNTDKVPDECQMCNSPHSKNKCDSSNWHKNGVIVYDGQNVIELEKVNIIYENSFEFLHGYYDEYTKTYIENKVDSDFKKYLAKWFNSKIPIHRPD